MYRENRVSDATPKGDWYALRNSDGLFIVRRVECVICCKRKRHLCKICNGTGIRDALYGISESDARNLLKTLKEVCEEP
jgi:hypothetical protein